MEKICFYKGFDHTSRIALHKFFVIRYKTKEHSNYNIKA